MISNFLQLPRLSYCLPVRWAKVTIIGVGLLGGSIGLALKKRKLAVEVQGYVRRKSAIRECLDAGAVDRAGMDLLEAVHGAELVILCTPIAQMEPVLLDLLPALEPEAILTDVGSVKVPVVRALSSRIRKVGAHFVGSHPMAGSEKGGVRAARPDLFRDALCVVTPDGKVNRGAARKVESLWRSMGSRVLTMNAADHDRLVSRSSHLPHLVAAALAKQVLDPRQDARQAQLAASGFRDTTRVACSSPDMWRDIALGNRANLIRDLAQFEANLAELRRWLTGGKVDRLERFLTAAQRLRMNWQHGRLSNSQE